MKLLFKLAWRNIWRNKRRSILTLSAIAFATLIAVAMRGVQLGTYAVNIKYSVNLFSGFLQIQKEGYQKNPSLNKNFKITPELKTLLERNENILGFAPRIGGSGLISHRDKSQGAFIVGVEPSEEKKTTKFFERVKQGRFFEKSDGLEIVVGQTLLENLKAEIGDTVVILSQGVDGSLGNLKFKIVGTVKFGSPEIDQMAVFMGLYDAQDLMAMYGRINMLVIKLDDLMNVDDVKQYLNSNMPGENLAALDWMEVSPELKEGIEMDNASGIIMLVILMVIVAFGILNTVLMSVTERFREFGISLSIGMPQVKLVAIIFMETIFLAVVGIIIGDIIGYFINSYIVANPIEFTSEIGSLYEEYGWLPRIESTLDPFIFINTSLSTLVISIAAGLYPAYKVFKLEPLKGIRYT